MDLNRNRLSYQMNFEFSKYLYSVVCLQFDIPKADKSWFIENTCNTPSPTDRRDIMHELR